MKNKGFTLIELLVTTAVISILGVPSAVIISSILRSQNKTAVINEVRQNGDYVISRFERDVKQAESICRTQPSVPPTCDGITGAPNPNSIDLLPGPTIWACNGVELLRNGVTMLNQDTENGVSVETCSFTVSPSAGSSGTQIVKLDFRLRQRSDLGTQEFRISEPFSVTAGTRPQN